MKSLEEFARECAQWSDEYLLDQLKAGPDSYAAPGYFDIIRAEASGRGHSPLPTSPSVGPQPLPSGVMQANNEVVIALSKGKIVGSLAILCVLIPGSLWMASLDPAEIAAAAQQRFLPPGFRNPLLIHAVGWAGLIVGSLLGVALLRKLVDSRPGLILNGQGIVDNSSAFAAGLIPWPDISGFDVYAPVKRHKRQRILVIKLIDPEKYIARGNRLQQALNRMNYKMCGSPIAITSSTLRVSFDDMLKLCSDFQQRYGTAS